MSREEKESSLLHTSWDHDGCFDAIAQPDAVIHKLIRIYPFQSQDFNDFRCNSLNIIRRFTEFLMRLSSGFDYHWAYNGSYAQTMIEANGAQRENGVGHCFSNLRKVAELLNQKPNTPIELNLNLLSNHHSHSKRDGKLWIMSNQIVATFQKCKSSNLRLNKYQFIHFDDNGPGNIFDTIRSYRGDRKSSLVEILSKDRRLTPDLIELIPDNSEIIGLHFSLSSQLNDYCFSQRKITDFDKALELSVYRVSDLKARIRWLQGWVDTQTADTVLHQLVRRSAKERGCEELIYEMAEAYKSETDKKLFQPNLANVTAVQMAINIKNYKLAAFLFLRDPRKYSEMSSEILQQLLINLVTDLKHLDHSNHILAVTYLLEMGSLPEKNDGDISPLSIALEMAVRNGRINSIEIMLQSCRERLGNDYLETINPLIMIFLQQSLNAYNLEWDRNSIRKFVKSVQSALRPHQIAEVKQRLLFQCYVEKKNNKSAALQGEINNLFCESAPIFLMTQTQYSPLLQSIKENNSWNTKDLLKRSSQHFSVDEIRFIFKIIREQDHAVQSIDIDILILLFNRTHDLNAALAYAGCLENYQSIFKRQGYSLNGYKWKDGECSEKFILFMSAVKMMLLRFCFPQAFSQNISQKEQTSIEIKEVDSQEHDKTAVSAQDKTVLEFLDQRTKRWRKPFFDDPTYSRRLWHLFSVDPQAARKKVEKKEIEINDMFRYYGAQETLIRLAY